MMWSCNAFCSLLEIFNALAEPCFAVVGYMIFWSKSMSLTFRLHSSIGLKTVSLLSVSLVAKVLPELAMSISSLSLVGILIALASGLYNGISHLIL